MNFDAILTAFINVLTPLNLIGLIFGVAVGIIIGALPGLSVNMGIALLFPLTFSFQGIGGILMLLGVYCGAIYGGSISAILLKTPGTPASAATTIDGYPMAVKYGQPGRALGLSTFSSTFGGIFSAICLMIFSPLLASVALQFSKPEYFALAIFGISIITSVSSGSVLKGLMGGVIGLIISTIGIDAMSGQMRMTFGTTYLLGGLSFVPVLIGLFAFSQVLASIEDSYNETYVKHDVKLKRVFPTIADLKECAVTILRSSIIGTVIGAVPGTGGDISSFISYNEAKRWSKHKEKFGDGAPEGICAPEAGNNAVSGGAMMVQGMQPGPLLFQNQAPQVYTIFLGLLAANFFMGLFGFSAIRLFVKVINIPKKYLMPIIFTMTFVGAFAYNNSITDVFVMVGFGFLGYFLNKMEFSMSAIVIGIILGSMAESNFRGALMMSDGSLMIFLTHPICAVFLLIALISLLSPLLAPIVKKLKGAGAPKP